MVAHRFLFFHWPWITSLQGKSCKDKTQADKDTEISLYFRHHGRVKQERSVEEVHYRANVGSVRR